MLADHALMPGLRPDTIKLTVVPQAAPPYDGSSPETVTIPFEPGSPPDRLAIRGGGPAPGSAAGSDWAIRFAHLLAETLAGSRPVRQMAPLLTERARVHLRKIGPRLHCEQRPRIVRVITTRPGPDVMEMTVIVGFGTRTRAVAVRFERSRPPGPRVADPALAPQARWLCTDVEAA